MTVPKRTDRFIRLTARLRDSFPGKIKGVICGDGPLRLALEQQAAEAGLARETLEFRGSVSGMEQIYAEASIFVLTSDWEGTPNVVMEAMACGLPVVATDVGGLADLIRHKVSGLLVDKDNEEALFLSVKRLIEDAGLRKSLGQRARMHIEEQHSLERLPMFLESLYQSLLINH